MARLKDVKNKVYFVLRDHEKARNNDGTLIAHLLNKHYTRFIRKDADGEKVVRLKDFQHFPSFESIRRARQIIQNDDNEFLPTDPKVAKARRIKEEDYRNAEVREAQHHQVIPKTYPD